MRYTTDKKMNNFVAIDFETANGSRSSVCSVGVIVVQNGEITDSFYSLIHPAPNYYASFCQEVHGLGYDDTDNAPDFPDVWEQVEKKIHTDFPDIPMDTIPFVAHNACFDEGCLRAVFAAYEIKYPEYLFMDTLCASRRHFGNSLPNHQLQTVAAACGYDLRQHHHALADAEACARIAMMIL